MSNIRTRFVSMVGSRAAHALQDGVTIGSLLGLTITFKFAAILFLSALGIDGLKPRKLLRKADTLVRTEQIEENPEYFAAGFILGALLGAGVGLVLAAALEASKYSAQIPEMLLMV